MVLAFYVSAVVIMGMMLFIMHLYSCIKSPITHKHTVVMVISMIGSFYVGMVMQVFFLSLVFSMVTGVMAGIIAVIGMGICDINGILHGLMQSLMGGMMGGMLSGMVAIEKWELMIQLFSLFVFSILLLTLYFISQELKYMPWIQRPLIMAAILITYGLLLSQVDLEPVHERSPHIHAYINLIENNLS